MESGLSTSGDAMAAPKELSCVEKQVCGSWRKKETKVKKEGRKRRKKEERRRLAKMNGWIDIKK